MKYIISPQILLLTLLINLVGIVQELNGQENKVVADRNAGVGPLVISGKDHVVQLLNNGVPWFDGQGKVVNAHGACLVEEDGRYYLFGEYKTDSVNQFMGFSCYSSPDLVNWKFERLALPVQEKGLLGPNRIGERVKVMKCPNTGEFVMYMHTDDMKYNDPHIGYATCKTVNGEYKFKGALLYQGAPIQRWDMGTFQDNDGQGYVLIHHGDIYQLSQDYHQAEEKVTSSIAGVGESPAMFKKEGTYYLLSSNLTSWERNDNCYHTAPRIAGPWTKRGLFCPAGTLTYNSQCSFVFPLVRGKDTIPLYMGDRWSFPKQREAATQVWQPMQVEGIKLSIPIYWSSWDVKSLRPVKFAEGSFHSLPQGRKFASDKKGDLIKISFRGESRLGIIGESNSDGGYARVSILDQKGKVAYTSLVDFYSKVSNVGLRFVTPSLGRGEYILQIGVSGDQGVWYNKRGDRFGSNGYWVRIHQTVTLPKPSKKSFGEIAY